MEKNIETTHVGQLSVMESVKVGFNFILKPDGKLLSILGCFALSVFVVSLLTHPLGEVAHGLGLLVVLLVLQLPLTIFAVKKTLTGDDHSGFFGLLSQDVSWRVLGASLLAGIIVGIPLFLLVVALVVAVGASVDLAGGAAAVGAAIGAHLGAGVLLILVVLLAISVYLFLRFALVVPFVVDHNKVSIMGAFAFTRGLSTKILGVSFLIMIVISIVMALVGMLLGLIGGGDLASASTLVVAITKTLEMAIHAYLGLSMDVAMTHLYKTKKAFEG